MGRLMTYEQYLNMLSERVVDNTRQLRRTVHQRRNGMEDLYGVCFSSNGDAVHPASFYISLSPDYVYLQRFAFKFVIKPFSSSVSGVGAGTMTIGETLLTNEGGEDYVVSGTSTLSNMTTALTPNPHTHTAAGELSGVNYGVKKIDTASIEWSVSIDGIDITPYLKAQHDGAWLGDNGMGIYPSDGLGGPKDFYDILEVCSVLTDEGDTDSRDRLLESRFKKVEISSDAPFGVDAYLYLKYSNMNR